MASAKREFEPDRLPDFERDIEQIASLGCALTESDPVPLEMLGYVHHQAVHEAGHALVCHRLEIRFDTVRIIYDPGVRSVLNAKDHKLCLVSSAGAAAEDVVFGREGRQKWDCVGDRRRHEECGGTDFEADVVEVRKYGWFSKRALLEIASSLERSPYRMLGERKVRELSASITEK